MFSIAVYELYKVSSGLSQINWEAVSGVTSVRSRQCRKLQSFDMHYKFPTKKDYKWDRGFSILKFASLHAKFSTEKFSNKFPTVQNWRGGIAFSLSAIRD